MSNVVNGPIDLRDRTREFARQVIRYIKPMQKNPVIQPLCVQLIKSATSIGANFVEAKDAPSKKDFRNKVFISKKEAAETYYWLQLFEEFENTQSLRELQMECRQIILILQKIITTLDH